MRKMKGYKRKALMLACILFLALFGCSGKEKDKKQDGETKITESAPETTGVVEQPGNSEGIGIVQNAGNVDGTGDDETVGITVLAKADFNGDGVEDSICAEEVDKSGLMKELCLILKDESGETSVKVPEAITVTCYQESGTEFQISCDGLDLGTTTLDEKPAYGVLSEYLEKTMGMSKSGDSYKFIISGSEFSMADAECHGGTAVWCRGKFYVEGKEYAASWTQEYSLGEWVLTSMELPMWNVNGPNTGWGLGRGEMSKNVKKHRYVGYLDEANFYQDMDMEDFDGDGILDRIWKDCTDSESYTIHFGNGKTLEIIDSAVGDWIDWYVWPMTEETTVFWVRESGMSTGGDWMILRLFEQTENGLVPMELPEGPTLTAKAVSERKIAFYWEGQEPVVTLYLDEIYSFADLTVEEWLERHTEQENGEHVLRLWHDAAIMMEESIQWRTYVGDNYGDMIIAWNTKYVDGDWETTAVYEAYLAQNEND